MPKPSIYSADHPLRQLAIRIIENCIEPVLGNKRGETYYALEDAITLYLNKTKKNNILWQSIESKLCEKNGDSLKSKPKQKKKPMKKQSTKK